MVKISWKPGTLLAPVPPALVSCGTLEKPNVMTAAWTGIICSDPTLVYVSIRPSRYSYDLIKQTSEFVINVSTVALAKAVDLCGVKSGRNVDKFKLANITAIPCTQISAPQIAESPISLECRVRRVENFGTHDMFLAEVVAVDVDDDYLSSSQAFDLDKAGLLAYAHGFYYALGKKVGKFGWSVEKKSTKRKRLAKQLIKSNVGQKKPEVREVASVKAKVKKRK